MLLRGLAVASLLLTSLAPAALADEDNDQGNNRGQASSTSLQFTSGTTSVTVTPPGGSATMALTCTNQPVVWSAAISGTQWISPNADCTTNVAAGNFTYMLTFTVPSGASNLNLSGSVLADDSVTISLNGNNVPLTSGSGSFAAVSTFGMTSGFQTGTNTLTFTVNNIVGPSGLDFTAAVTGSGVGPVSEEGRGQCVAAVAHETARGRGHGEAVRNAAHTCRGDDSDEGD